MLLCQAQSDMLNFDAPTFTPKSPPTSVIQDPASLYGGKGAASGKRAASGKVSDDSDYEEEPEKATEQLTKTKKSSKSRRTVYLTNIPEHVGNSYVYDLLKEFGEVEKLEWDPECENACFIRFTSTPEAVAARLAGSIDGVNITMKGERRPRTHSKIFDFPPMSDQQMTGYPGMPAEQTPAPFMDDLPRRKSHALKILRPEDVGTANDDSEPIPVAAGPVWRRKGSTAKLGMTAGIVAFPGPDSGNHPGNGRMPSRRGRPRALTHDGMPPSRGRRPSNLPARRPRAHTIAGADMMRGNFEDAGGAMVDADATDPSQQYVWRLMPLESTGSTSPGTGVHGFDHGVSARDAARQQAIKRMEARGINTKLFMNVPRTPSMASSSQLGTANSKSNGGSNASSVAGRSDGSVGSADGKRLQTAFVKAVNQAVQSKHGNSSTERFAPDSGRRTSSQDARATSSLRRQSDPRSRRFSDASTSGLKVGSNSTPRQDTRLVAKAVAEKMHIRYIPVQKRGEARGGPTKKDNLARGPDGSGGFNWHFNKPDPTQATSPTSQHSSTASVTSSTSSKKSSKSKRKMPRKSKKGSPKKTSLKGGETGEKSDVSA